MRRALRGFLVIHSFWYLGCVVDVRLLYLIPHLYTKFFLKQLTLLSLTSTILIIWFVISLLHTLPYFFAQKVFIFH